MTLSFFKRFFRWIRPKPLDHKEAQIAERREQLAKSLTEWDIYVQTVYNALKADGASESDKLIFALGSLPQDQGFEYTKDLFREILEYLVDLKKLPREEADLLIGMADQIGSLEELFTMAHP